MLNSLWPKASKTCLLATAMLLALISVRLYAQKTTVLPHSTPEAQGVSASGIDSFLTAVRHSKHEFHSIMILRHGKVIAEGWWNPYKPELKHSLYSLSKSFTSTAIGFAVSEKKLSLDDKVISFFPESLPDTIKPYLAALTVHDLITMTAGQDPDPTSSIPFKTDNWIKAFLATPIVHKPGSQFLYNTMATFMLSSIIQKVTGQKEIDYLKPRLFDPLEIKGEDWEVNKQGINTGGWGLRLKTEDLAKMGQLYLQRGVWSGKQVLPAGWVKEATSFKIDQAPDAPQSKKDSSDWMQGYCYQFWRCRHNAYRGDGAFGQYIIVMPDQDAVIAITSETADMQGELNLVWKYLLPAMHSQPLAADKAEDAALQQHLDALNLPPLLDKKEAPNLAGNNKTYEFKPNALNIKSATLNITANLVRLTLKIDSATYTLNFAHGKWLPGTTDMKGPSLLTGANEDFAFLAPYKVDGSFGWQNDGALQLKLRYIESPHSEIITFNFTEGLKAVFETSFSYGRNKIELDGNLVK